MWAGGADSIPFRRWRTFASFHRSSNCGSARLFRRSRRDSAPTPPPTRCARRQPPSGRPSRPAISSLLTEPAVVAHIETAAAGELEHAFRPSLEAVINATGVVIHTNLGRAPLAGAAIERVVAVARGYSSLEYDLERGGRGRRDVHAEALLCRLTSAGAAVVVNNNAAATMLVLAALAAGREVIVSRGELVEIGGGFRVPDVMAQSGAVLREVGTTNKTRAADYASAITDRTALILQGPPVELPDRGVHRASVAGGSRSPLAKSSTSPSPKISEAATWASRVRPCPTRVGPVSDRLRHTSEVSPTPLRHVSGHLWSLREPAVEDTIAAGRGHLLLQRRQTPRRSPGRDHRRPR